MSDLPPAEISETATPCPACGYPLLAASCSRCPGQVRAAQGGGAIKPGNGFFLADLIHGFTIFFRSAFMLIHRKEFVGKLSLPVLANIVALIILFAGIGWSLWEFFAWTFTLDWGWMDWLREGLDWVDEAVAFILALICVIFLAPVVIETVTAPFLEPLAEASEKMIGGPKMKALDTSLWHAILHGLKASAQILAVQILVLMPCLILAMFGIGTILAVIVSAFFNALVWFELPFTRRGYNLRTRFRVLRHNWPRAMGYGLAFQVGLFIPFFNFLLLTPTATVAASILYFHFEKSPGTGTRNA